MITINRLLIISAMSFLFSIACNEHEKENNPAPVNDRLVKGEELFRMHCITCHSLRYIEMQPDFTRKTWEKITDKMIKSFGAPIPDSSAAIIVDYLMSVKGAKE